MGPGDILKLGLIILPLIIFLMLVGTKVIDNATESGNAMQEAAESLKEAVGSTW